MFLSIREGTRLPPPDTSKNVSYLFSKKSRVLDCPKIAAKAKTEAEQFEARKAMEDTKAKVVGRS